MNGGAIALGHPIGASGGRIVGTMVHELRRSGGGLGLAAILLPAAARATRCCSRFDPRGRRRGAAGRPHPRRAPRALRRLVAAEGKAEPGESWEDAALREVREETGYDCTVGGGSARPDHLYDHRGKAKEVRWFAMQPTGDLTERDGEVNELRWLTRDEANEAP